MMIATPTRSADAGALSGPALAAPADPDAGGVRPALRRRRSRCASPASIRWCSSAIPTAIKEIFTADPDALRAGEANVVLAPFVGTDSVLLADGPRHRRKRRLMMPPFHGERMQLYGDVMRTITDRVIDAWPLGTAFPIHAETQRITLDVILRAVFGLDEGGAMDALRTRMVAGRGGRDRASRC